MSPTLAIAEHNDLFRFMLTRLFRRRGHDVIDFDSGTELVASLLATPRTRVPSIVIADVQLPGTTGLAACHIARGAGCTARFIFMSTFERDDVLIDALSLEPYGIFKKPFDVDTLIRAVDALHTSTRGRIEHRAYGVPPSTASTDIRSP